MDDTTKKELDQLGDLVDSKIEKAMKSAEDNAKGEYDESLKSEISNLSSEYLEKHEAMQKRLDGIEVSSKKLEAKATAPATFKSALKSAIDGGAIDNLKKGKTVILDCENKRLSSS